MTNLKNNSTEIEDLRIERDKLALEKAELQKKVSWYEEQIRLFNQKRFGSSREKIDPNQMSFFNETELVSDHKAEEPKIETITYSRKKRSGSNSLNLDNLPEEEIHYELPEEERVCPTCKNDLHDMGVDVKRALKIVPAQAIMQKHIQHKYACRCCEKENIQTSIHKVKAPEQPIPKSVASPSALAFIMSQKYAEGLPLYRQEKYLEGLGFNISRQVMANWMIKSTDNWLKLVYARMKELLVQKEILHADETGVQVLHEDGREAKQQSYMWLYRTGKTETPIVLYEYQTTRSSAHPIRFLNGFKGYLQTDGYSAYKKLENVTQIGCWSHARRKYKEAIDAAGKGNPVSKYALEGIKFCDNLFAIEQKMTDMSASERLETRQTESQDVLDSFKEWLDRMDQIKTPKSHLGKAITYCLNQWDSLVRFTEDERLELSNNRAERSIKPFVIGRKAWLFSNTPKGANASSVIYSIVETAKENDLVPFKYLQYLFEKLPNMELTQANIDLILPWSKDLPQDCTSPSKQKNNNPNS